jgi:hypothetical protein
MACGPRPQLEEASADTARKNGGIRDPTAIRDVVGGGVGFPRLAVRRPATAPAAAGERPSAGAHGIPANRTHAAQALWGDRAAQYANT